MTTPNNATIRKRSKNFLPEEEVLLMELVEDHRNYLESKKSGAVIWKQKEQAWRNIEEKFGRAIGSYRHWRALRDKYESMKRKSKNEMADQKLETYRRDGAVASTKVSTQSAKIPSTLGDSANGLQSVYDSDSHVSNYMEFESSIESVDQKEITSEKFDKASDSRQSALKEPKSKELVVGAKRKRNIEDERMELIILQQNFYRDENKRAQEKHEHELQSLKYKNELLQLELEAKQIKKCLT